MINIFVYTNNVVHLHHINKLKTNKMEATKMIKQEMKRRKDLVNDMAFRKSCVELAKKIGITPKEWNENKAMIILLWANEFCSLENKV